VDVADNATTVYNGPCIVYGIFVNTVLSAHACPILDGTTTVLTLPASLAAGTNIPLPGIRFNTSLIVDPNDAATGGIVIAYRPVNP
jgi:heme/copper-type cytochrome/quinol oxidase subunit 1